MRDATGSLVTDLNRYLNLYLGRLLVWHEALVEGEEEDRAKPTGLFTSAKLIDGTILAESGLLATARNGQDGVGTKRYCAKIGQDYPRLMAT
jgi:hypothetical protein